MAASPLRQIVASFLSLKTTITHGAENRSMKHVWDLLPVRFVVDSVDLLRSGTQTYLPIRGASCTMGVVVMRHVLMTLRWFVHVVCRAFWALLGCFILRQAQLPVLLVC